ncbi:hypothetical protein B0O99DRAFT_701451, partial [Bisporella sp. PMI_857]
YFSPLSLAFFSCSISPSKTRSPLLLSLPSSTALLAFSAFSFSFSFSISSINAANPQASQSCSRSRGGRLVAELRYGIGWRIGTTTAARLSESGARRVEARVIACAGVSSTEEVVVEFASDREACPQFGQVVPGRSVKVGGVHLHSAERFILTFVF